MIATCLCTLDSIVHRRLDCALKRPGERPIQRVSGIMKTMSTWNLSAGDPLALTLAADARLTKTDYTDDQIWELNLEGGEPAALALQTTYGLRAHWMRLFPRFVRPEGAHGETVRMDPAGFSVMPRVVYFSTNRLAVTFAPFDGLEVLAEYWIPESNIAAGRIRIVNQSILPQSFRLEWAATLNPMDRQGGMVVTPSGPTHLLTGETAYLAPVVFLTGGPQPSSGPYPALALELELYPGSSRQFTWAAAGLRSLEASMEAARLAAARPWEAEQTRADLHDISEMVQVHTGNPDWDAAFALAQKSAFQLFQSPTPDLPHASFVLSRRPDQGFSTRGDGSEYSYLWNGQTALESLYAASLLLPGAPHLAAGLLRNFLAVQDPSSGFVDGKPGLGGQRSRWMAQPLLAALAVKIGANMPQPAWYQEVFGGLWRFFQTWFTPRFDRDEDGWPEWEQPLQTGVEDSPIFDLWSGNAQGIEAAYVESPALAAMLLNECRSLLHMARILIEAEKVQAAYNRLSGEEGEPSEAAAALPLLEVRENDLLAAVQSTWDGERKIYRYRDLETHLSTAGQTLVEQIGPRRISARKRFTEPHRLVLRMIVQEERTYAVTVTIHGFNAAGEISETLEPRSFHWLGQQARATTHNTFLAIKRIDTQGMGEEDQLNVFTADYTQEDCSLLLPLWAGAPEPEQARQLVEETLYERYLQLFGIPLCPPDKRMQEMLPGMHTALASASLPWNHLIGEGLLRYGYRAQAADLVTRLMNAVILSLKGQHAFRQYYHAEAGVSSGEAGHLHGIAPLGLFLQTLGLLQLGEKEILVDGFNPFPWIIHVQYRKIHLTFFLDHTEITFAGGQKALIDQPGVHRVALTESNERSTE